MAMLSHAQGKGPLVLTPAKELALQIADVARRLAERTDLRVEVVWGPDTVHSKRAEKMTWWWPPGRFMELYLRQAFNTGTSPTSFSTRRTA